MWVCRVDSLKMTGGNTDPANSNAGDRRNNILELARAIREADNQKAQLPKVQVCLFDGTNASAWADKFEQLGNCCKWSSEKMLQMVKRYCMVEYKEEVLELVQASRDWPDFKAKLLDKYQLGDQLLNLADLRKMLYRLLKQQKEDRENEGVSAEKDQAVYKTLTDMRNMMADMKEERLKLQVMMVQTKALIDDGAEMNIIREREAMGAGVNINRADTGFLRIAGTQNRADGLSRIEWDSSKDQAEDSVPVDGFLETDEQQLSINVWEYISNASSRPGKSIWSSPSSYQKCAELVMREPFFEEDPWGKRSAEQIMRLALSDPVRLLEEPLTIEVGHEQGDEVLRTSGGMVFLVNSLIQEDRGRLMLEEGEGGEIKEAFREEEYDGTYKKIGLWLNGDLNEAEIEPEIREKAKGFVVRQGHLFKKSDDSTPKRVVCGVPRQLDVIAALHDGVAGGHRSARVTLRKIQQLYFWDGMGKMVAEFCSSCVPCQKCSNLRYAEPLNPRYVVEPGAVVHLDLVVMPPRLNEYRYIFDARDNLTGFVDGRAIRERTGKILAECIEEFYLRYPFVREFVMDRGGEFRAAEVQALMKRLGVNYSYTTRAHPQANAPVERGHATFTNLLAKWCAGKPSAWPVYLRAAIFVESITVKRTTGYTPVTLWFGRHATFPIESFLTTWQKQDMKAMLSTEELLDLRARQIQAAKERVVEAVTSTADSRRADKVRWDKQSRVRKKPLEVGDIVLLYDSSLEKQWSRKLDNRWMGPYRIIKKTEHGAYEIEEMDGACGRD
ncbi:hypothetical protein CBR_g39047 [Chara braunii]|uniref:Integrase catalytic domain-containing protein n=1 Tax=Chara braunii TaxID=69332 RepID=A0A388LR50_CHABU|nr:hypothetical protein CBR_g39047 [Chara braunii]|eukprot:GBG84672.1 hypothetical protein CBR_g39047 [Chara braunii]